MLMYFVKEILICILLSSIIIGAGHYAVYVFEHNKNINYPLKTNPIEPRVSKPDNLSKQEPENNNTDSESTKIETKKLSPSKNKDKLKESLEILKKLT